MFEPFRYLTALLCAMLSIACCIPSDWTNLVDSASLLYSSSYYDISCPEAQKIDQPGPEDSFYMPLIGNGYIATTIFSESIFVAGVFNGEATTSPSHRARIPSLINIQIVSIDSDEVSPCVDASDLIIDGGLSLNDGIYYQRIDSKVEQVFYAHQKYSSIIVHSLQLVEGTTGSVDVCVASKQGSPSIDFNFSRWDTDVYGTAGYDGWTQVPEIPGSDLSHVVFMGTNLTCPISSVGGCVGTEVSSSSPFNGTVCFTLDSVMLPVVSYVFSIGQTKSQVKNDFEHAKSQPDLEQSHVQAWQDRLNSVGSISVSQSLNVSRAINASLYAISCSTRNGIDFGLSPGSLGTNGYNGHSFWDTETWMLPALLLLDWNVSKSCINYRFDRLSGAFSKAAANDYQGAMFPWESAYSGEECTPTWADTGKLEQHISSDISFALKQYSRLHRNDYYDQHVICPIAVNVSEFWRSRVEVDEFGTFHINKVIPPDEYAVGVNDSVFTNAAASLALDFGIECVGRFPQLIPFDNAVNEWRDISDNLAILYDSENKYHPEFLDYIRGTVIKQADVILLTFPLQWNTIHRSVSDGTSSDIIAKNDLEYYSNVTDPQGPAMTWAMNAIGWLQLASSESDYVNAATNFYLSFQDNLKGGFLVWQETPTAGSNQFITGAGGFLQSVVFGYAGIRIPMSNKVNDTLLYLTPNLLPSDSMLSDTLDQYEILRLNLLEGQLMIDLSVNKLDGISLRTSPDMISETRVCAEIGSQSVVLTSTYTVIASDIPTMISIVICESSHNNSNDHTMSETDILIAVFSVLGSVVALGGLYFLYIRLADSDDFDIRPSSIMSKKSITSGATGQEKNEELLKPLITND